MDLDWRIFVKKPHLLVMRREGDLVTLALDDKPIATFIATAPSSRQGKHRFDLDDHRVELRWLWRDPAGPIDGIVLVDGERVLANAGHKPVWEHLADPSKPLPVPPRPWQAPPLAGPLPPLAVPTAAAPEPPKKFTGVLGSIGGAAPPPPWAPAAPAAPEPVNDRRAIPVSWPAMEEGPRAVAPAPEPDDDPVAQDLPDEAPAPTVERTREAPRVYEPPRAPVPQTRTFDAPPEPAPVPAYAPMGPPPAPAYAPMGPPPAPAYAPMGPPPAMGLPPFAGHAPPPRIPQPPREAREGGGGGGWIIALVVGALLLGTCLFGGLVLVLVGSMSNLEDIDAPPPQTFESSLLDETTTVTNTSYSTWTFHLDSTREVELSFEAIAGGTVTAYVMDQAAVPAFTAATSGLGGDFSHYHELAASASALHRASTYLAPGDYTLAVAEATPSGYAPASSATVHVRLVAY